MHLVKIIIDVDWIVISLKCVPWGPSGNIIIGSDNGLASNRPGAKPLSEPKLTKISTPRYKSPRDNNSLRRNDNSLRQDNNLPWLDNLLFHCCGLLSRCGCVFTRPYHTARWKLGVQWRDYHIWRGEIMMTSSNGNIFCIAGLLCGEFTGHRWILRTKASDAELLCFLWSALE